MRRTNKTLPLMLLIGFVVLIAAAGADSSDSAPAAQSEQVSVAPQAQKQKVVAQPQVAKTKQVIRYEKRCTPDGCEWVPVYSRTRQRTVAVTADAPDDEKKVVVKTKHGGPLKRLVARLKSR